MPTLRIRLFGQSFWAFCSCSLKPRCEASRSVAGLTAQLAQCSPPGVMDFLQPPQRFSACRAIGVIRLDEIPFASRLCVWVKWVGGNSVSARFWVVHHELCHPLRCWSYCAAPDRGCLGQPDGERSRESTVTVPLLEEPLSSQRLPRNPVTIASILSPDSPSDHAFL
jgi:hypothetical protein